MSVYAHLFLNANLPDEFHFRNINKINPIILPRIKTKKIKKTEMPENIRVKSY